MEIITALLMTYLPMWAPAIVAVLGVAVMVFKGLRTVKEIRNTEDFKALKTELRVLAAQNAELARTNKLLLDQITHIQGYADAHKEV
jgi:hypothetical protein